MGIVQVTVLNSSWNIWSISSLFYRALLPAWLCPIQCLIHSPMNLVMAILLLLCAVGRVKIQAYRGPSEGKGYDAFAPWGFYVTQPKDNFYGYGHAPAGYH